jgi:hypothetical protein
MNGVYIRIWKEEGKTNFKVFSYARIILSFDSSVGIATVYGVDGRESIPITGKSLLSSQRPKRLWGLSSWYHGIFPPGGGGRYDPGAWSWPLTSI